MHGETVKFTVPNVPNLVTFFPSKSASLLYLQIHYFSNSPRVSAVGKVNSSPIEGPVILRYPKTLALQFAIFK